MWSCSAVTRSGSGTRCWPAVLAETYLPGEATPVHAAWAAHLETVSTEGIDELRRLGDLASHHERAGDGAAAFGALLQGADLAEKLSAPREAADLLAGAADLWEAGADAADVVGRARLLERPAMHANGSGGRAEAYRLIRSARDLVSPEREPLWASRLMVRLATTGWLFGESEAARSTAWSEPWNSLALSPTAVSTPGALPARRTSWFWNGRTDEARRIVEDAVASPTALALPPPSARPIASDRISRAGQTSRRPSWTRRPAGNKRWLPVSPTPSATRTSTG